MDGAILFVSAEQYDLQSIEERLQREGVGSFTVIARSTMDEAEPCIFEESVRLLVADAALAGVAEFVRDMRADDAVRHIPAMALVDSRDRETVRTVLETGFDTYLQKEDARELLLEHLKPLLRHNLIDGQMMSKISDLQEKSIRDFLQLDLIKNYIPRTLWDIAKDFAHRQKIEIPEEELELTIVFGDLTEFTPRTQRMEPEDVIAYLNTAFEVVARWTYEYAGDIDKFIGDAFLGVFATPMSAVQAMVNVQKELQELNRRRAAEGFETMQLRIGIHTGPVIRGNVGGHERYDNTLIGDTVNIAARLEQIASPGSITISDDTRRILGIQVEPDRRRTVSLKGRSGELEVFDLCDYLSPQEASRGGY